MKSLNDWTRHALLRLPSRAWDAVRIYDSLLILSSEKPHDSGWAMMVIIGVLRGRPCEIVSRCSDDVEWKSPPMLSGTNWSIGQMRTDCCMKSGALHFWQNDRRFKVGTALSSITIEVVN